MPVLGWGLTLKEPLRTAWKKFNSRTQADDSEHWFDAVKTIAAILARHEPRAIFFPHRLDWNRMHIGTHLLIMDALKTMPSGFQNTLTATEFWGQMPSPNLMVESSVDDVADLLAALSNHAGEVRRNPYHLRMPAWLPDNVRSGAELVGDQGGSAPDFKFATLYGLRRWKNGRVEKSSSGGIQIGRVEDPAVILGWPADDGQL